jgi:hypothetical protein
MIYQLQVLVARSPGENSPICIGYDGVLGPGKEEIFALSPNLEPVDSLVVRPVALFATMIGILLVLASLEMRRYQRDVKYQSTKTIYRIQIL